MYTSGTCVAGLRTFYPGSRLVFALQLGPGVPLGGTLTLLTCGLTHNNTVLYVGTGCPTWSQPFACQLGNDDAADFGGAPCGDNPSASALVLRGVTSRSFFVQLGGYGGEHVTSGLRWAYAPASLPTTTRTRSRTALPSQRRASPSATATRTRSRKRKVLRQ